MEQRLNGDQEGQTRKTAISNMYCKGKYPGLQDSRVNVCRWSSLGSVCKDAGVMIGSKQFNQSC
jgi:hypothetical protein